MTPKSLLAPARLAGRPVLRSQSDDRLVDLARAGSEPAFEAIVARYRAPLMRYCRRILPEARAEDAVQQAFVGAFAALRRDDAHIDLRPWLYRIAHNTALNVLRDRGLKHSELDEMIDGVERPDQAMERRQRLRDVIAAVKALPERQRDAMVLRELEGRSYEEIALELGVTGGAVRQLLNRARTTLRAGVTAVTPLPLVVRLCSGEGEPSAARIGDLVGAGGAGALATKVAATAIVTGAVAGGIAVGPVRDEHHNSLAQPPAATAADQAGDTVSGGGSDAAARQRGAAAGTTVDDSGGGGSRGGSGDDSGSGKGSGDDRSGSGSGDDAGQPGRDDGGSGDDHHSGSGGSGSGGSGSGQTGDDHSGSGETPTGSEGPGPGGGTDDGSGSSGSGSSGSGSDDASTESESSGSSSGHGSGDSTTTTTPTDTRGPD